MKFSSFDFDVITGPARPRDTREEPRPRDTREEPMAKAEPPVAERPEAAPAKHDQKPAAG